MGRRSRKRRAPGPDAPTRAERDAARERRAEAASAGGERPAGARTPTRRRADERPPPPWGSFPLTELLVLLGIGLAVAGLLVGVEGQGRGRTLLVAGIVLGMLGGLETAVRDHFAGYRSHTTLLSGATAVASILLATFLLRQVAPALPIPVTLLIGAVAFATAFPLLRRTFQRRSGGLSFR